VPVLADGFGWRAPYWSALAVVGIVAGVLAATPSHRRQAQTAALPLLADRRLLPLGVLQAATFGLSVVLANWVTTLLERDGHGAEVAGAIGSLTLLAGVLTRPLGGWAVTRFPAATRPLVAVALVVAAAGAVILAAPLPLALRAAGAAVLGLAAGLPFATVFAAAQAIRPDAPAAAIGLVNSLAIGTIVLGTPLIGLTFSLPGDGRIGFVAAAAAIAAALAAVRAVPERGSLAERD
jgi:nitrate/nitrite transporter NarK